jgi:hypothetical protein
MDRWTRRSLLAAGLSLAACTRFERPPLGTLYRPTRDNPDQPPLLVIPGAFGSCLRDRRTGHEVWPGSSAELLASDYRGLEVAIDPATLEPDAGHIEAYAVFREGLGRDFYGEVLRTLQQAGGYARCGEGAPPQPGRRNFYVYVYDFRLDNIRAVHGLHAMIERIRADHGDPHLAVDVLAHSNGGLLARYYARYGATDLPASGPFAPTGAGAATMRRLLLVGTPNLGTMQPVLSQLRGEEIGLRNIPSEVVATCTGAPQMMPHPAMPWLVDVTGRPVDADLFDIATWRRFGWSVFDPRVAQRTVARHGGGAEGRHYLDLLRGANGRGICGARARRRHRRPGAGRRLRGADVRARRHGRHAPVAARTALAQHRRAALGGRVAAGRAQRLPVRAPPAAHRQSEFPGQPAQRAAQRRRRLTRYPARTDGP